MGKLENRVAIVTGAGRNISEAIAQAFADEGARVAVVDLDSRAAETVAKAINETYPDHALAVTADVAKCEDVRRLMATVADKWGGIDLLVNNVAITDRKTVLELEEDEWDRVMTVCVKSQFLCSKYAAERMIRAGKGGNIICIASTSGHRGRKDATAYSAAKAATLNLARSLAIQLAPHGIRVNSVTPNRIGSPVGQAEVPANREVSNLVGRRGVPRDIAAACVFLASDEASFIAAADILVDGGSLAAGAP